MGTMQAENIPLTLDKVLEIQNKIDSNKESATDYEQLDFLLSALNMGGILLRTMQERGFYNYDRYIQEKRKSDLMKSDVFSESYVNGTIKESILLLKNYFKK